MPVHTSNQEKQMNRLQTNCKGCVFAISENGEQSGCKLNRSAKLGVDTTAEDGDFILSRFCNTYRPNAWFDDLTFDESLNPESTVMKEVACRLGFFVYLDTTDGDNAIKELTKTMDSICKMENGPPAYVAVVTPKVEFNEEIWSMFVERFDETDTKYHVVQMESHPKQIVRVLDTAFAHAAQNGWIYSTTSGQEIPSDVLVRLNNLINVNMKQITMIEPYEGFNGLMFPAYLFKFLNGNKVKMFDDENVDSRAFIDKMKAADKRSEVRTILTWEEFNAS